MRNPFRFTDVFEGNPYFFNESGEKLNLVDYQTMEDTEYPELIENVEKFIWTKSLPRKCKLFNDDLKAFELFDKAAKELITYQEFCNGMIEYFVNELKVPKPSKFWLLSTPFCGITDFFRGLKGASLDLRRHYSEAKEAVKALAEHDGLDAAIESIKEPVPDNCIFGVSHVELAHSICNNKQWAELYWPYFEKMLKNCQESNSQMHLFSEAEVLRFADFFQDLPKGLLMIQPEADDVFEMRKRLPNVAICGGMKPEYLGKKSKEECLDYARKLISEIGADGGFVVGQTKMMSYRTDAKSENIIAVQELCKNYRG